MSKISFDLFVERKKRSPRAMVSCFDWIDWISCSCVNVKANCLLCSKIDLECSRFHNEIR